MWNRNSRSAYVSYFAEGTYGRSTVVVFLAGHVLCERTGHDDDVIGNVSHLFDEQVDHATNHGVFGLEELGHCEERRCGFFRCQIFAL